MSKQTFDLKVRLANGKVKIVQWVGEDGADAECRFADCHRYDPIYAGGTVIAWRWPVIDLQIGYRPGMLQESEGKL